MKNITVRGKLLKDGRIFYVDGVPYQGHLVSIKFNKEALNWSDAEKILIGNSVINTISHQDENDNHS